MSAFVYTDHHIEWEGIALLIKWCPALHSASARQRIAHLEIHAANGAPLPARLWAFRPIVPIKAAIGAAG